VSLYKPHPLLAASACSASRADARISSESGSSRTARERQCADQHRQPRDRALRTFFERRVLENVDRRADTVCVDAANRLADDPTDIIRARTSVAWAELPFERPRDSISQCP
jgi:hypothetical protein